MMQNAVLDTIFSRRSVRAYKPEPIPGDLLTAILEAGQAAPYVSPDSRHFSVITDRADLVRLGTAAGAEGMKISDFHRELFSAPGFDGTYGAPAAVLVSGNESTVQYEAVCAAAVQNMLIAAQSLGLASCWAYFPVFAFHGGDAESWRKALRIPDGYRACASILLGYGVQEPVAETADRYQNSISFLKR